MTDQQASGHRFFQFCATDRAAIRTIALQLANFFQRVDLSRTGWKNRARQACKWEGMQKDRAYHAQESVPFNLTDIEKHLEAHGTFKADEFRLPTPMCWWLDGEITMASGFHHADTDSMQSITFRAEMNFGPNFPLQPMIDREGMIYSSFQRSILQRIKNLRQQIVTQSHSLQKFDVFQLIRDIISESICLIENTLHQLYYKAEFDPLPGWRFDRTVLLETHNRRITDKLRWVAQITGKQLDARDETAAFLSLKRLRNHLNHFDPPCFACSWEEVGEWLNCVLETAWLAWKIRDVLGQLPCVPLIELLLQPPIAFVSPIGLTERLAPTRGLNYDSTSEETLQRRVSPPSRRHMIVLGSIEGRFRLI